MPYSVAEVAQQLGVNHERVRAMIAAGLLRARKLAGRWLIEEASVRDLLAKPRPVGRPFSVRRSWGVLMLASGRNPDWLSASDVSRLRGRLRDRSLVELARRLERRAQKRQYRAHPSDVERIAAVRRAIRTGVSAAADLGLEIVGEGEVDIYIPADRLEPLIKRFALQHSERPNVVIRAVPEIWPFRRGERVAPAAVVGVDLLGSTDARFQRVGRELLEQVEAE